MTPDEIERTMQFLLTQQAQFTADMTTLRGEVSHVTGAVLGLTQIVGQLAEAQLRTEQRLDTLTQRMDDLAQRTDDLAQAQRRTDDHLGVLIEMFERHLREDHGIRPS